MIFLFPNTHRAAVLQEKDGCAAATQPNAAAFVVIVGWEISFEKALAQRSACSSIFEISINIAMYKGVCLYICILFARIISII